jgi:hypothetical protein
MQAPTRASAFEYSDMSPHLENPLDASLACIYIRTHCIHSNAPRPSPTVSTGRRRHLPLEGLRESLNRGAGYPRLLRVEGHPISNFRQPQQRRYNGLQVHRSSSSPRHLPLGTPIPEESNPLGERQHQSEADRDEDPYVCTTSRPTISLISARAGCLSSLLWSPFFHFPLSRLHNQPPVRFHFPPNTWRKQPRTGLRSVPGLPTTIHPGLSRGTNVQVASGCPSVDFHTLPR